MLSIDTLRLFGQVGAPSPDPVTIDATNGGGGSLAGLVATVEYPVGDSIDWLAAVLTGVIAPTPLTLTSQSAGLSVGIYEATVVVSSVEARNSPVSLPVTLSLTGLTIDQSDGGTAVSEAGDTDTLTVVWDGAPASDVVLDISSADAGEVTISPATLTFTPNDWDTPQAITATGVDDDLIDGAQTTSIRIAVNDSLSDDSYDPIFDHLVSVTTADDDSPGLVVTESDGSTSVSESGGTDDFTVELQTQPTSDVVILVSSGDTDEAVVGPALLTFTPVSWNIAQTVTVTGVDDPLLDGTQTTAITLSVDAAASDDDYDTVPDEAVDVTTTDNDAAGFTITEIGGTSVSEAGGGDNFTVRLIAQPAGNVVLAISSADPGEVSTAPGALTFTPGNWSVSQTVTLTGVDDNLDDGDQVTVVTVSVDDALSDDNYDPVADQTVSVTTIDDDAPGFTVIEIGGTTVTEGGGADNFTVRLNAEPTTDVVLDVVSADTGEATVSPAQLTFTPVDWATIQTVTVTGVDDNVIDGDQLTLLTVSVDTASSDDAYDALADQTVSATTQDNDAAGAMIAESDGSTAVNESGTTDGFTVRLDAEPTSDVVFTVTSGDLGEAIVAPVGLTFTPANWSTSQTVLVTGVDDDLIDGTQVTAITISVDPAASDDDFDGIPDGTVSVTTTDDDAPGFTTSESGGTTEVAEAGGIDVFSVALDSEPVSDVVLTVGSSDTGEATVSPAALTFTPANWSVGQTVTVTGVDESVDDGDQVTTVTISVDDANSDDDFDPLADRTVTVTTFDDDQAGFTIVESGTTTVTEAGSIDDFTVVLDAQPTSDVVLRLLSGDTGEATISPAVLTFTPANWNAPRSVNITGVDDALIDGPQLTDITIRVDDAASDDVFDPLLDQLVNVTTTDDDAAGFTVTEIGGTVVTESGSTDNFNVVLEARPL